jgi:hypothetical protein
MQKYVNQLLEMMQEAHNNRPAPRQLYLPEEMKGLEDIVDLEMSLEEDEHTMESIFGVPQMYFPPENRLSGEQVQQLTEGILDLWHVFNYEADIRKGEFTDREIYTKLVDCWKKSYPLFRGTNGAWHIEMYDYELNWDVKQQKYVDDDEYYAKFNIDMNFDDNEEQPF